MCLGLQCVTGGGVRGLSPVRIVTGGTLGEKLEGLDRFGVFRLLHQTVLIEKSIGLGD